MGRMPRDAIFEPHSLQLGKTVRVLKMCPWETVDNQQWTGVS